MNGSKPNKIIYTVPTKNNYLNTSYKQQKAKYSIIFPALQINPSFFLIKFFSHANAFVVFFKK